MDFVVLGMIVWLATPTPVELSHWMGVRGWGHPISVRDWRSGIISLAIVKRPASSASAADDIMFFDDLGNGEDRAVVGWDRDVF